MKALWRWVLLIGGGLVAAALIGAGLLAYLVSRLDVRGEVERSVESVTGRQLTIAGDVGVSYWPALGLRAEDVTLANVEGGRAAAFIAADEINIGVEIRPLFDRQVVVRQLVLQRPQIALEVDAAGKPNWVLTPPARPGPAPTTTPQEPAIDVARTSLREVNISDGEVSFFDARRGAGWVVGDVDLKTALEGMDQPMQVRASLRYADQPVRLEMEIGRPGAAMRGELTPLSVNVESELLTSEFQGQTLASSGEIAGTSTARGPSLRRLAAWMGSPIQGAVGLEQFAVSGHVEVGGGAYSFSNAGFAVDRISGRGDFVLSEHAGRPYLSGRLEVFDFDLNPYLTGQAPPPPTESDVAAAAASPQPQAAMASTAEIAAVEAPPRALDVQAAPSEQPISFAGLKAFDADIELVTAAVLIQRMRVDRSRLNLVLNNGYLAATLHNMTLYGGSGSGRFEIDAREPDTRIVQDLAFSNLDARRFLTDAINFNNIEGRAELALNMRTQGRTQSQLINALDGSTHLEVVSGTLHGVDLGGVSTTIRNALRGELIAPEATTPFQGLSATFLISDGVLASDDISFNTADLRIPGVGLIDLPQRRLDLRLAPRSPRGGIVFPFSMRGPWTQLGYSADISDRALREISARVRTVKAAARASAPAH
jgi:AsmA protein